MRRFGVLERDRFDREPSRGPVLVVGIGHGVRWIGRWTRIHCGRSGGAVAAGCGGAGCAPVVVRGVCRAWSGRACCGPGRPVRVEDWALTDDLGNHGIPKCPRKPNIPRLFSMTVAGELWVRGVAGVAAEVRFPGPSERDRRLDREPSRGPVFTVASIVSLRAGRCSPSALARERTGCAAGSGPLDQANLKAAAVVPAVPPGSARPGPEMAGTAQPGLWIVSFFFQRFRSTIMPARSWNRCRAGAGGREYPGEAGGAGVSGAGRGRGGPAAAGCDPSLLGNRANAHRCGPKAAIAVTGW
jgi:hypothetical protein